MEDTTNNISNMYGTGEVPQDIDINSLAGINTTTSQNKLKDFNSPLPKIDEINPYFTDNK